MCEIANVSKSGYYKWLKSHTEIKNKDDLIYVYAAFLLTNKKGGFRKVKIFLERYFNIFMNHKKIIRLMKILNLKTRVRKTNPYKSLKRNKDNSPVICENILQRNFKSSKPFETLCSDITYLKYNNTFAYLNVLMDTKTNEIISYRLSKNLSMEFVHSSICYGIDNIQESYCLNKRIMLHTDRGIHYTNSNFQKNLSNKGIIQSMSNPGTPLDNAVIESFFGHLKDEIDYKKCKTFESLSEMIDNYMFYYNYVRPQWTKNKMTPIEYRNFLLAS